MRRVSSPGTLILLGLVLAPLAVPANGANAQPNVVMIMADDIGWSDLAVYRRHQGLSDPIPTPNIDRLAAEGMMFTDAHSPAANCAPTRFSMLTGSNPYRNGRQWGSWSFRWSSAFTADRRHTTVAEVMKSAGYRTAFFGKMHFGGDPKNDSGMTTHNMNSIDYSRKIENLTTAHGFDYSFGSDQGVQAAPYLFLENDRFVPIDPAKPVDNTSVTNWPVGYVVGTNGVGSILNAGVGDVDWNSSLVGIQYAEKAVAFIDDHLTNHPGEPFLLYYMSQAVHGPHTPPIDFDPNPDGTPGNPVHEPVAGATIGDEVADMVYELDLQVGKIINKLEDPDQDGDFSDSILANTLIFFTSDNGGLAASNGIAGYDSTGELRGYKGQMFEGGHRVPFIARWGDGTPAGSRIAPGSISDELICAHDWVGAMYALTEQGMESDQSMDCVNMLPVLFGQQPTNEPLRDFLILQSNPLDTSPYGIRQGNYMLFLDNDKDPNGLYDLSHDLSQSTNLLIGAPPLHILSRRDEMEALFQRYDDTGEPRSTEAFRAEVSSPGVVPIWTEDFFYALETGNRSSPFPAHEWHCSAATDWQRDSAAAFGSVAIVDAANTLANPVLLTGFGYDEVEVRYYTEARWDLGMDYTFTGKWELSKTFASNHLGFIAGIAEYDVDSGDIVQKLVSGTFGDTNASVVDGATGAFSVAVASVDLVAAGVSASNYIGVFFHHDDVLPLFSDASGVAPPVKNDAYGVDDLVFGYPDVDDDELIDMLEQRVVDAVPDDAITNISDVLPGDDFDRDGASNEREQRAGTDLALQSSVLRIEGGEVRAEGGQSGPYVFEVAWQGVTGKVYRILSKTNLLDAFWTREATDIPGKGRCLYPLQGADDKMFVTIELVE